jgi:hypothetical protein
VSRAVFLLLSDLLLLLFGVALLLPCGVALLLFLLAVLLLVGSVLRLRGAAFGLMLFWFLLRGPRLFFVGLLAVRRTCH